MNSYSQIKKHIKRTIKDQFTDQIVTEQALWDFVSDTKMLITQNPSLAERFLPGCTKVALVENDWNRIARELESELNVKMSQGVLIENNDNSLRDKTWWSDHAKNQGTFYWDLFKEQLKDELPSDVVKTIDKDTDVIMNNLENPNESNFSRYGMVVGHVQSGKTGNYSALMTKAADSGYKFIVVIAGGMNNLRNQTQKRIDKAFTNATSDNSKKPISLTTQESDFNKQDANRNSQGLNFDNSKTPIVLVIKKNVTVLKNVILWLENTNRNKIGDHSMLLIDDEADYASIDTNKGGDQDPTAINKNIRKLLSLFKKSVYVAYTATPYANIFIDPHKVNHEIEGDLFPKDFIYALDAPDDYFGAQKIFKDSNGRYIRSINDHVDIIPPKHKKTQEIDTIPESLKEAIQTFILNISIRNLRGQFTSHNSMLIHATWFTAVHQKIAFHVEEYLEQIRNEVLAFGSLDEKNLKSRPLFSQMKRLYQHEKEFSWEEIVKDICENIKTVFVKQVHGAEPIPLEYPNHRRVNVIVIGGTSLARGYTLEGLNVSYFLRTTSTYDTLMQMGRWFGYRIGYDDLCKIYMTRGMQSNFKYIIDATNDLFDQFKTMAKNNKTPKDFGLYVEQHPDSLLQITALNKQRNVTDFWFDMNLDGHSKETSWLSSDENIISSNLKTLEGFTSTLLNLKDPVERGKTRVWLDVDKGFVQKFLEDFQCFQAKEAGFHSRMPIDFIKEYVKTRSMDWDIALYGGKGDSHQIDSIVFNKEIRQANLFEGYIEIEKRQVSSGTAEAVALPEDLRKKYSKSRRETRQALTKPLLMLHILDVKTSDDVEGEYESLAAFGVSFPANASDGIKNKTVKVKANMIYEEGLDDFNLEREYDD